MAGVAQCVRESSRTAFRLLQRNEKSSVPLNELCMRARKRATARTRRDVDDNTHDTIAHARAILLAHVRDSKNIDDISVC
jgi:hypothetical protein